MSQKSETSFWRKRASLPFLLLAIAVAARALSLGHLALLDPTETRYACIAQDMVLTGDWITPKLPMPEGIIPYLGKPPLHFWATALSYKFFSINEWATRLPGFLFSIGILLLQILIGKRFFSAQVGVLAALLTLSSALFFILAGASATDMTLSFFVALGLASFCYFLKSTRRPISWPMLVLGISASLAFLTKGPIGLVLLAFPIAAALWSERKTQSFPFWAFVFAGIIFVAGAAPWFILSERIHPGFLKYFIWNENIARYLMHDYGDLYGSGHEHFRGSSWWMIALGFLPWTPFLLRYVVLKDERKALLSDYRADPIKLLIGVWAISAPVFFALVRQLHMGTFFRVFQGLGLLLAERILSRPNEKLSAFAVRVLPALFLLAAIGVVIFAAIYQFLSPVTVAFIAAFYGAILFSSKFKRDDTEVFLASSFASFCCLSCALVALTPYLNSHLSSDTALRTIVDQTAENKLEIGIFTKNTFSYLWLSRSGEQLLGKPVTMKFIDQENAGELPNELLIETKNVSKLPAGLLTAYQQRQLVGSWSWWEKKGS